MSITADMMEIESRLFVALLNRAPDGTHFALYAYDLESGRSPVDIAQRMVDEFGAGIDPASGGARQWVNTVYANLWGHAPDTAAAAHWQQVLASGATPAATLVQMIDALVHDTGADAASQSSRSLFEHRVTVAMHYAEYGGNELGAALVLQGVTSDPASVNAAIAAMAGHWNIPADTPAPAPVPAPVPEPAPAPVPAPPPPPDPVVRHGLPEHASEVAQLYLAYFGRPPDWSGLDYYLGLPQLDLVSLTPSFAASPESARLYGTQGFGAAQIHAIYNNLFNRDAEADGLAYWSAEVQSGRINPAFAALAILWGAQNEDRVSVAHKLDLGLAFISHVDTASEVAAYSGDAAAQAARAFLRTVDASASSRDLALGRVDAQIAALPHPPLSPQDAPVELVGVQPA